MGFAKDFMWGAASAAYQIEGACDEDGKGPGIWDVLAEGHVKHGENGNVACDHYHRYREDVALMKEMGLKAYRFSVSWPRVMPKEGVVNEQGLAFYRDLVQELVNAGIEPMCTLYHWNLPMWLHKKGGWHKEEIMAHFTEYTEVVVDALSDKVSYWMTFNEPTAFIGGGYAGGVHAPFENLTEQMQAGDLSEITSLTKHVLMAHGKAVQVIREKAVKKPNIGMALCGNLIIPWENTEKGILQAKEETFNENSLFSCIRWWADPVILGEVPQALAAVIGSEELRVIHQPLDFFGYNCYHSANYDAYFGCPKKQYPGMPRTAMDWPITPDALYWAARFYYERYRLPILITENGMANLDFIMSDGKIHDPQRIEYLKSYLGGLQKAAEEGIPMAGYLYWSILDNFEWTEGYDKRFGLVYVDYRTQRRVRKDSSYWYEEVIAKNGL